MDISTAHHNARLEAARIPALEASLSLIAEDSGTGDRGYVEIFGGTKPTAGDPPAEPLLVTIEFTALAGVVDEQTKTLVLDTPIEGQITGADPLNGTLATWARVYQPDGSWWADLTVSVTGDGGEVQMTPTGQEGGEDVIRLFNGAFARLTSIVFNG